MSFALLAPCLLATALPSTPQVGEPGPLQTVLERKADAPVDGVEIVVGLQGTLTIGAVLEMLPMASVTDEIKGQGIYSVEINAGNGQVGIETVVSALKAVHGVHFAEPSFQVRIPDTEACHFGDDVSVQQCTIAFIDGTPSPRKFVGQSALAAIGLEDFQGIVAPSSPVVAVIDTGLDFEHPLFHRSLLSNGFDYVLDQEFGAEQPNGIDDDADGLVDEALGHGTHVAGTVLRVAPTTLLLPYRALDSEGNGSAFNLAQAIYGAVDDGAQIINLSVSLTEPAHVVALAILAARDAGVAVFTSSGNTASPFIPWPGSMEVSSVNNNDSGHGFPQGLEPQLALVTVSAVTTHDELCSFSSWGPAVDIAAPGQDVYSALYGGGYGWWSGTSMATAVASGAAALVLAHSPSKTPFDATEALLDGAVSIDALNPEFVGGLGAGRLSLSNSVETK